MTRKEVYDYLLSKKQGERESIIEEIEQDWFDEFRLIGFIREGMDGNCVERWKLTDFGREQITAYLNFCKLEEEIDSLLSEKVTC